MEKSKRAKESKIKIWFPILCIVVVAVTFYMIHDIQSKIEKNQSENIIQNSIVSENKISTAENIVDQEENTIENEVKNEVNNQVKNEIKNEAQSNTSKNTSTNNAATPAVTDQKQKAIELVKKEWGADNSVDFVFDYINENGEYVVAVKDRGSATVKYYFRVDLATETVELD